MDGSRGEVWREILLRTVGRGAYWVSLDIPDEPWVWVIVVVGTTSWQIAGWCDQSQLATAVGASEDEHSAAVRPVWLCL